MAGPWFTVQKNSDDWRPFGELWLSNGKTDGKGTIEIKLRLETLAEAKARLAKAGPASRPTSRPKQHAPTTQPDSVEETKHAHR